MGDLGSHWPLMVLTENKGLPHDNLDGTYIKGVSPFSLGRMGGTVWDDYLFLKNYYEGNKKCWWRLQCPKEAKVSQVLGTLFTFVINSSTHPSFASPYPGAGTGLIVFFKLLLQRWDHQFILLLKPDLNCRVQRQKAGAPRSVHSIFSKRLTLPFTHTKPLFTLWLLAGLFLPLPGFPKPSP